MAKIILEFDRCVNNEITHFKNISCPYAGRLPGSEPTIGAGFAVDYFCKLTPDPKSKNGYKQTSGDVEWSSEVNPIPTWCPLRTPEDVMIEILER